MSALLASLPSPRFPSLDSIALIVQLIKNTATHFHFIRKIPMFARYEVRVSVGAWDDRWIAFLDAAALPITARESEEEHAPHLNRSECASRSQLRMGIRTPWEQNASALITSVRCALCVPLPCARCERTRGHSYTFLRFCGFQVLRHADMPPQLWVVSHFVGPASKKFNKSKSRSNKSETP
ncbi:hypothetical protein FB451DRAFT_1400806 [Mycena latifolia]|nr:hypothetical protein FB451DRAFT_1400806 [Mycena latifolia]